MMIEEYQLKQRTHKELKEPSLLQNPTIPTQYNIFV